MKTLMEEMIDYNQLSPESRVWIYQSDRKLTKDEILKVEKHLWEFVGQWASHSNKVKGYGAVYHNHFLVLIADETEYTVGGCSTDSAVRFVKDLGTSIGVDFFNRFTVACEVDGEIQLFSSPEFKEKLATGEFDENIIVFNNLVQTKAEFETGWRGPVKDSWHQKVYSPIF